MQQGYISGRTQTTHTQTKLKTQQQLFRRNEFKIVMFFLALCIPTKTSDETRLQNLPGAPDLVAMQQPPPQSLIGRYFLFALTGLFEILIRNLRVIITHFEHQDRAINASLMMVEC